MSKIYSKCKPHQRFDNSELNVIMNETWIHHFKLLTKRPVNQSNQRTEIIESAKKNLTAMDDIIVILTPSNY